jgi:hypothetical protein
VPKVITRILICPPWCSDPSWSRPACGASRSHSVGLLWTSDQPDNTQYSQETNIHAPGGIRTQAAADPNLRPHGRLTGIILWSEVDKCSEVWWSVAKCCSVVLVLEIRCQTLLEDIQTIWGCCLYIYTAVISFFHIYCIYGCVPVWYCNLCIFIVMSYCTFMHLLYVYVFIVRLCIYFMFMYSLYVYVSSSCQLALFCYPDWGFSVLFPQL